VDVVVCGAHKPFMYGGAEQHQENLVAAIRAAGHRADLVRLPVAWEKGRLFDSPLAWRLSPIDADVVIATNFPSYFVRHPAKVVWLLHQHRGAFDMADAPWTDFGVDEDSLERTRLLTEWDAVALSEAVALFTTSGVVADRLARYTGLSAEPLYHPPPLAEQLRPGDYGDYVLAVNRFAENKRPGLLVEALAHTRSSLRAVVAGSGELLPEVNGRVRSLGLNERVSLPGRVEDGELVDLFANALAVVYAPSDEDYGYVTLQAFSAGKPVVTSEDAGGVLEWVEDGVTGFVTDGTPAGLGAAVDRLVADPELAQRMGDKARERVADLSWGPVVTRLLGR
jgi:glycosyltransferase involved in cell wall biosynthesis